MDGRVIGAQHVFVDHVRVRVADEDRMHMYADMYDVANIAAFQRDMSVLSGRPIVCK